MKQLSDECIKAIKDNCHYPDRLIFQCGATEALTNPEIYTKADLISKEDTLGFAEWISNNAVSVDDNHNWEFISESNIVTTEELYNLYINQKKVK